MPIRRYTPEQKAKVVEILLSSDKPIIQIARETKISEPTLSAWKREALGKTKESTPPASRPRVDISGSETERLRKRVQELEVELARKNSIIARFAEKLLDD